MFPARLFGLVVAVALGVAGCSVSVDSPDGNPRAQADYAQAYADWAQAYVDCARRFGTDAFVNEAGSIVSAVAEGRPQRDGLDAECLEEVGEPPSAPPATKVFLSGYYQLLVEQGECLRSKGFDVGDPPTQETWVENYSGDSWDPVSDVLRAGGDVFEALRACPQPDPVEAERRGSQ